jgi:hypothetical protein
MTATFLSLILLRLSIITLIVQLLLTLILQRLINLITVLALCIRITPVASFSYLRVAALLLLIVYCFCAVPVQTATL